MNQYNDQFSAEQVYRKPPKSGKLAAYIHLARIDHWTKHVFVLPGVILAQMLAGKISDRLVSNFAIGMCAACLIASANYVLNEWLDRYTDRIHPTKSKRKAASYELSPWFVYTQYAALLLVGLALASMLGRLFFATYLCFAAMGIIYNVKPFRSKDRVFLDVMSESINNPLRLLFGWGIVSENTIPPLSILIFYWFGGAFLMSAKRLAEFRHFASINGLNQLGLYRRSFQFYTENSLLVSTLLYATLSSFFIATFLIKYRAEYLLLYPLIAILFAYYFSLALKTKSIAQTPEFLHKDGTLVLIIMALSSLFFLLSYVEVPILHKIVKINAIEYEILNVQPDRKRN